MRFEEPKVEFIQLNLNDTVFSASGLCSFDASKCTDAMSGTTESCVGSFPFAACENDIYKEMAAE